MKAQFLPYIAVWEVTRGCNLRCKHCGNASGKPRKDELTIDEVRSMVDSIFDMGTRQFCLTGGEPLTRADLREIIKYMCDKGANVGLISNGLLLTAQRLQALVDAGLKSFSVSIDGDRETHNMIRGRSDAFDRAMAAIRLAATMTEMKVAAVTSVSKMNLDQLDAIKAALIDAGCQNWLIQMVQPTGRMSEHSDMILTLTEYSVLVDKIIEMKSDTKMNIAAGDDIGFYGVKGMKLRDGAPYIGDGAGIRQISIGPSGEIKGAPSLPDEFIEGNIRVTPVAEIWNDPDKFTYARKMYRDAVNIWCRDCRYLPLCRSGCVMSPHRYQANGDVKPLCTYLFEKEQGLEPYETPVITQLLEVMTAATRKAEQEASTAV